MKIDLDLGHTRLIIREADRAGVLRNQLACAITLGTVAGSFS